MQIELLYKELGQYGTLQRWVVWVTSTTSIWTGLLLLTSFFVLVIPNHRCAIPGLDNDTYAVQNDYHLALINKTIPVAGADDEFLYDQCHYYKVDEFGNATLEECSTWVYDRSKFKTSLAADLNMVCGRAIMKSNAQMVNFAGIFVGSLVTGILSDKFGRKTAMCTSLSLIFFCSLAMAWSPNYLVYISLTFLVGFFNVGYWMPSFVIKMEFVGPLHRKLAAFISPILGSFGQIGLAGLAYAIRDWSLLLIVASLFGVIYFPLWSKRLFPESVRWLHSRGKNEEAKKVLKTWGKWNKVNLSESFFEKVLTNDGEEEEAPPTGNVWNLFSTKTLAVRTTLIFLIWIFVCLGYYGLTFNAGDLGVDLYLNFMLQTAAELPASVICIILLDRIGRKPVLVGSMMIGGVALLGTIFTLLYLPEQPLATTFLALVGKIGLSAGFPTVYIYSAELFPTVVRNSAMGASSSMARIGGMLAPYVADMDRLIGGSLGKALPQVVFAALTIAGGMAAIFLPETLNKDLPETLEEAAAFGKNIQTNKSKDLRVHVNEAFSHSPDATKI